MLSKCLLTKATVSKDSQVVALLQQRHEEINRDIKSVSYMEASRTPTLCNGGNRHWNLQISGFNLQPLLLRPTSIYCFMKEQYPEEWTKKCVSTLFQVAHWALRQSLSLKAHEVTGLGRPLLISKGRRDLQLRGKPSGLISHCQVSSWDFPCFAFFCLLLWASSDSSLQIHSHLSISSFSFWATAKPSKPNTQKERAGCLNSVDFSCIRSITLN